ncbi:LPS-assembly protein [Mesocricetibacter intestinalis]|uniref:LPS-assembly protein LptD n=1 Tax=Mesocricetibacter intestinalis TaxID=1521930 RepID=A0A4R6VC90_9PAST|nr:LPS assembly protein LptD [Mesocricetibacter intestinalis]TDQ57719.1 LPS-assembly protein [Mesocricetibacter intestinalis]
MKKNAYSLLSFSLLTLFYSSQGYADLTARCLAAVPHFSGEPVSGDVNNLPVYIEADSAELNQSKNALYQGNVELKQGNRHLISEQAEVVQSGGGANIQRYAYVRKGFDYKDNLINLKGDNAKINLNSKDADLENADYQFVGRQGRGSAESAEMRADYRLLKNAVFTSCLPDDKSWSIEAVEMRQHIKEEYAEMWHARFKVAGVPVFYTPYLQFPIGDRRRSGLLFPAAGSSSRDGYWYSQPVYWNIAPNYDMTLAPKYMSHRGWQLNGEFRYLTLLGEGKIAGEYLSRDRYKDYIGENKSRHLFYWTHYAKLLDNWRLSINYTKVSDKRYFTDFDSPYGSSTDGYADQTFKLSYYQPNYNLSISSKQFQVFDEVDIGPYYALPQIDYNYYRNGLAQGWLDFKLFAQAVHFDNESNLMPTAWRFHLEPSLNLPLSNRYGSMNIETKLYATHYQQKKGNGAGAEEVQRSVNRVLPQLKVDLQTVLASNQSFIQGYTQTLEPHIQYLYRPYKDQSNIGSRLNTEYLGFGYDSALLQQDYFSLFRDRRYSGLDRIASANQITLGGTSRFYDQNAEERFNLSLGQTVYLNNSRIDDKNATSGRSSSWSLENNWKISDSWNWRGSYQYDTRLNEVSLANASLEFNPEKSNLLQLNYRYASKDYINQNLTSGANSYNQNIKQVGITAAWELSDNWALVGRYYHDIALGKAVEQYAGIRYNTCCWSMGVGARRYLTSKSNRSYSNDKEVFYDNSFGITFELRGLGNDHHSGIVEMLEKGMLPYIRPFNL